MHRNKQKSMKTGNGKPQGDKFHISLVVAGHVDAGTVMFLSTETVLSEVSLQSGLKLQYSRFNLCSSQESRPRLAI